VPVAISIHHALSQLWAGKRTYISGSRINEDTILLMPDPNTLGGGSEKTNLYFGVMRYFLTVVSVMLYSCLDFHSAKTLKTKKSEPQTASDGCEKRVYEISLTWPPWLL
jgi:hypothetical protein